MSQNAAQKEQSKKEKVIKAAVKLFSEQGYHDTAVSEIADEAGVAKGTVYWYFDSKEQLFWGIILSELEFLNEQLKKELENEQQSSAEKIEAVIRLYLKFFKNGKETAKMIQESSVNPGEYFYNEMYQLRNEAVSYLAEIIKTGQKQGEFKEDIDCEEVANFILGSIFGSYNPHAYQLKDIEGKVDLVLNILCDGIAAK